MTLLAILFLLWMLPCCVMLSLASERWKIIQHKLALQNELWRVMQENRELKVKLDKVRHAKPDARIGMDDKAFRDGIKEMQEKTREQAQQP